MKYATLLTLVVWASFLPVSQTPNGSSGNSKCGLTRTQAPEIRGIRLGMTTEQLLGLFAEDINRQSIMQAVKESKKVHNYGVGRFDLRADREAPNPRFTGVNYITVELLDERVTSFHIAYAGPEWNTVDEFVAKLSGALRLPSDSWEPEGESRLMKCDGFVVDAYAFRESVENWVRVKDTSAHRVVENRREIAKEKDRQAFRP